MRAVVTQAKGVMEVTDMPDPAEPGAGEVIVRPRAVGICGSDFHFFLGELGAGDGSEFPRVQGHEVGATIEAVGPGCRPELATGDRVALWPLSSCGRCYPCRIGRGNVCDNFSLIGIHEDGGLQERLRMPESQVFKTSETRPAVVALSEPVSIAVRTVSRARWRPASTSSCSAPVRSGRPSASSPASAAPRSCCWTAWPGGSSSRPGWGRRRSAGPGLTRWSRWCASGPAARVREVVVDATGVPDAIQAARRDGRVGRAAS